MGLNHWNKHMNNIFHCHARACFQNIFLSLKAFSQKVAGKRPVWSYQQKTRATFWSLRWGSKWGSVYCFSFWKKGIAVKERLLWYNTLLCLHQRWEKEPLEQNVAWSLRTWRKMLLMQKNISRSSLSMMRGTTRTTESLYKRSKDSSSLACLYLLAVILC